MACSCKCRGVCPSCNTRRMVETAAQPHLPASAGAPVGATRAKAAALFSAARLGGTEHGAAYFLRVIGQSLRTHCAGAQQIDKAALHIGAVAFIHRFGFNLNKHVHFMVAWWSACRDRWTSWKWVFVTVSYRCLAEVEKTELNIQYGHRHADDQRQLTGISKVGTN